MSNSTKQDWNESNGIFMGTWHRNSNSQLDKQHEQTEFSQKDFFILVYMSKGKSYRRIAGQNEIMYEGDVLLISPDTPYTLYGDEAENTGYYYCCFTKETGYKLLEYLKPAFPSLDSFFSQKTSYLQASDNSQKQIRNTFVQMLEEFIHIPTGYEIFLTNCLCNILITFFRATLTYSNSNFVSDSISVVDLAIMYIKRNRYHKITLDEIAEDLHLSKTYLCRLFKQHLGKTVFQYVNLERVESIKDSLVNTNRPIILIQNDFDLCTEYLNRIFRDYTGCSMIEYRRKCRSNPKQLN